ncbi:tRNA pseudouridine(38-40) synthase TruA [Candidatus Weimeria sp. HCP3S3_B5]|uniref:tRNA pseudouridine(38-40) synthase TruA n=1 Tax=Candidatus Weimeria sp. HCP3S3_B5 TaxID=3438871 RepID=UPI002A9E44E7|nr:tRNA pseudouridine(38-40) synthase TruA [Lachnospiraceae bacterium]
MKNYKLKIEYDGSRYFGWEHQPDKPTIQGKIESVLSRMLYPDQEIAPVPDLIGAGRTDAGVHARGMIASVKMDTDLSCDQIRDYCNRYLPDDIAIREVNLASDRFHARYNAVGKTYRYSAFYGPVHPVFNRKYISILENDVDIEKMQRAAAFLQGSHDFRSFCGNSRFKKSTVRVVDRIEIRRSKGYIYFTLHGTGFLQNMVRIIVGTLLLVGQGRIEPEDVKNILEARDRKAAGPTAPAKGLMLLSVDY